MSYNGWKNYETWNVALWIGNDEGLYNAAKEHGGDYKSFAAMLQESGNLTTGDQVFWSDKNLDHDALNEMMGEL